MTLLPFPSELPVRSFVLRHVPVIRSHVAMFGGSEKVIDLQDDHWRASVTFQWLTYSQFPTLAAFIDRLAQGRYYTEFGHLARPVNFGTLTTSAGLKFDANKGDGVITLYAPSSGLTLRAGDMLKMDGLLLQCAEDCNSTGLSEITVPLVNTLRKAVLSGTAVSLSNPTAHFKPANNVKLLVGLTSSESVTLEFVERING